MRTIRSHEKDTQGLCHVVYVRFATPHGRQTRHVLARLKSALFVLFVFRKRRECEVSYDPTIRLLLSIAFSFYPNLCYAFYVPPNNALRIRIQLSDYSFKKLF